MIRKIVVGTALFCSLAYAQTQDKPVKTESRPATTSLSAEELEVTRQDLQRMRSLVQQMQTNLAYVTTIQGPLKHQFELEIEMWQLQIARMERQLNGSAERNESGRISK